jgi:hypothetical protein
LNIARPLSLKFVYRNFYLIESMIQFLKEIYLTGFALIFKLSRAKDIAYRSGGAIAILTLIEWFNLLSISLCIEMFAGKKYLFFYPKPFVLIAFFALFFINQYILFIRGHGIKFERVFDKLEKSKKILLILSFAVILLATIVFSIYSISAHRHFIRAS